MENREYVEILKDTLLKQVESLEEILEQTKEQGRLAKQQEFDDEAFERTLNRKEILIARLNELDDGFSNVYGRVRKTIQDNQKDFREDIQTLQILIKQCTDLGVEIKVLEERNREQLAKCFSNQHKEYGAKQNAATVASRYHKTMKNISTIDSYYMDKKN